MNSISERPAESLYPIEAKQYYYVTTAAGTTGSKREDLMFINEVHEDRLIVTFWFYEKATLYRRNITAVRPLKEPA